ncbi:ABC transporter permease [Sporanaerobacter sp. PP17-6a]|uniref:ABC transporter permease n=1 Tax=Sporanaerobacter sp. PP17-6a TaxID=1891289 RepID=UPI001F296A42|nr:ABC transporter permease subunit [Sporanaerobacter sp. PP17-6a]
MKIYSRRLTQILLLLLVIFAASASVFMKMDYKPSRDWRTETKQLIQTNEERLKLAELSPQLQAEAENKIKIAKYRLENNIPVPFGNPWLALLKLTGLVEMVEIVAIIIAADMVAREYTDGTMKFLLIRPHSRTAILSSKYMAVSLFVLMTLILTVTCAYVTNILCYGVGDIHTTDLFLNQEGQVIRLNVFTQVIKMYGLSIFPIMSYITIAFAISTILRNSALAVGSSLLIMILGNSMIEATAKIEWLKFLLFANSDVSLYIFHLPARPEMTLGFSISVLLVYIFGFLFINWIVFKKRDVSI